MMGQHRSENDLFSYRINLHERVRADHPLRRVLAAVDFEFVRTEVAHCYGTKGNVSVDPAVLLKMMFLLFFDDVSSERELLKVIPERLDYLFFLGYGLDDVIPHHSVLSKARARWGKEVFERFFIQTIKQCVDAGLVDGKKIHMDSTLVDANASNNSVIRGGAELIAALRKVYEIQEQKLQDVAPLEIQKAATREAASQDATAQEATSQEEAAPQDIEKSNDNEAPSNDKRVNSLYLSTTDPDARAVRHDGQKSRPRFKHHRTVDDLHGVITAVETTAADVDDGSRLLSLTRQHDTNTGVLARTIAADCKYGTLANFIACQREGIAAHMGNLGERFEGTGRRKGIFEESRFSYNELENTFLCPAGQTLYPRRLHSVRQTYEYNTRQGVCLQCPLRDQCTKSKSGRSLHRHRDQDLLDEGRAQSASAQGCRDRKRRQHLMERSFADATNNHGLKRARWRRLWRQEIQGHLIAACQNIRLLLARGSRGPKKAAGAVGMAVFALLALSYGADRRHTAAFSR